MASSLKRLVAMLETEVLVSTIVPVNNSFGSYSCFLFVKTARWWKTYTI